LPGLTHGRKSTSKRVVFQDRIVLN
jgi:hypothetical protein